MSSKSYSTTIRLVSYLSAALMLAQIVLMFIPYYNNGEVTTSIQGYIWLDYAAFKTYFKDTFAAMGLEYAINNEVGAPILVLVLGVVGILLNVTAAEKIRAIIVSLACGVVGIWAFLTIVTLKLGNLWIVHLILLAVVAVLAVLNIVQYVLENRSRIKV